MGSLGRPAQPSVDDLLRAAVREGGAVGDTAERLLNPKKSFFSTMSEATWKTLNGFVDTIQTPMYAVAGLLDPNSTIREAVEEKISPGDVLIQNKPDKSDPFLNRAGFQVGRFALDTLFDPLTYVTFGASRGVVGLTRGADAFASSKLAKKLGTKADMRVYLSESGEDLADRFLKNKRNGLRETFLKNERIKMVNKGLDEDEITRRLAQLDETADDFMIKEALEAPLDKKEAAQTVANLAGRYPHLIKEYIDKGGIKFFGKSMLSGQRIRKVKAAIPGMSALDKAMEPVRGYIGNMFSTNYIDGKRMSDRYVEETNRWKNIYEAQRDRLQIAGMRIKKELNLSDNEWEFVTAAVENGFKPSDPRARDAWEILHGLEPTSGAIPENIWSGVLAVNKMNAKTRRNLINSGIPVANLANYMPHLFVKTDVTNVPFRPSTLVTKSDRTKFATVSKLVYNKGDKRIVQFEGKPKLGETVQARVVVEPATEGKEAVTENIQLIAGPNGQFLDENFRPSKRIRASMEEARQLGVDFEPNALVASILAADDAIRVSSSRHFFKEVAEKFGKVESEAPGDFVQVNKLGVEYQGKDLATWLKGKNGEPLFFPESVAKHLEDYGTGLAQDQGTEQFLKAYDGLQNYFKAAVTSIFPAFHGRNALSNVFLAYTKIGKEALNPASHVAASNMLDLQRRTNNLKKAMIAGNDNAKEYTELMNKRVFTDDTGYSWTWGEIRTQLVDNVVAFHHKNLGQTDQLRFGRSQVREAAEKMFPKTKKARAAQKIAPLNPFNTDNMLFKGGFKIGQTIEDYSRTLLFLSYLKGTGDPMLAARQTKLALFDYSNLTKFEKNVMRRIVPFYSFSRKNLELQVNTLMQTPGRTAQQIRAVQSLGDLFSEDQLTEEELEKLPEWARKGYNVVSNREGSNVTLLRTLGTPLEELFNRADPKENLGVVSPLIKAPIEFASGYSFFHGRLISEVTQADAYQFAPQHIKDWIGYKEVTYTDRNGDEQIYHTSFAPWRMYTLNNIQPFGRFFSEVNRIEKAPDSISKMNALFFGFGTREFNFDREEELRIKENEDALKQILDQANLGYSFEIYVPKDTGSTIGDI